MRPEGFKRMFSVTYFPFNDIVIIIFLNFWFEISSPFLVNPADMISAGEWLFLSREQ